MIRQIALGAIIAFAATVLALSVWEPSAPVVPQPAPAPAPVAAPAPPPPVLMKRERPATFQAQLVNSVLVPAMLKQPVDAGAPTP